MPKFLAFILLLLSFGAVQFAYAQEKAADLPPISTNERVVMVPGHAPDRAKLEVTIMTPSGTGPFPLVVLNHGANGKPPHQQERYRRSFAAYYFLSRGYAVVIPMMRGFAHSEGTQIGQRCGFEALGLSNAYDIDAVVEYMLAQPYVDGERIVIAGGSFGGWNTLAYGVLNRPHVKGLISLAGGVHIKECSAESSFRNSALQHYAQATHVPSIWFYGDNDSMFDATTRQEMFNAYQSGGAKAELVDLGPFLPDTHQLMASPEALELWAPKVDAFLERIGMPSRIVEPRFLPGRFPPATRVAAIDDVAAVPYLDDSGRERYRKFLTLPLPRLFAVAPSGWNVMLAGGFDPMGLSRKLCADAGQDCAIYAIDYDVTWVKPPDPASLPPLPAPDAVPYLSESGRQAYRQFLKLHKPRAFALAPDGGYGLAAGSGDPEAVALAECSKAHKECRLYLVDDTLR